MKRPHTVAAGAAAAVAFALAVAPAAASAAAPPAPPAPTAIDLARTGTFTSSGTELNNPDRFGVKHINDGETGTRWSSDYKDDAWVQVEFAAPSPVHTVEIEWPNACARDFQLQTSTNGRDWTTATTKQSSTCPRVDEIVIDSKTPVSFVRMQGTKRWGNFGYSISEMRVWNGAKPAPAPPAPQLPLVPLPVSVTEGTGSFAIPSDAGIAVTGDGTDAAELLADVLRDSSGYELPITQGEEGSVTIRVADGLGPAGHEEEGYVLDVDADGVRLAASTAAGALNAVHTLRQLLPAWSEGDQRVDIDWTVPFVSIMDYPRFAHRGFMIDTARSFYDVAEVKRIIDSIAPLKLNRLHLHLTDDQGWRIAMDTPSENQSGVDFGLLTQISGKTAMTYNPQGALMGTELGHTGFYTKDDYREIVSYAAENGMMVIPEIDMPGHTNAALHAIPQLNSEKSTPKPLPGEQTTPHQGTGNVGESSFDADNPVTYQFIDEVLMQLAELTPGPYLHIGGDEAHSTSRADYTKMVDYATARVAELGKTVIGWNEYGSTSLPQDDAVIQLWTGDGGNVARAVQERGAKVILSPANKTYFPQKQDTRQPQGGLWACGGPCTLENAYSWNPAKHVAGITESDVLGVEGAFWGEFIRGVDQAQFYSFPRVLAVAEAGWTPQEKKNAAEFLQRVADSGPRLTLQDVNFFPTATVDWTASAAPTVTTTALDAATRAAAEPGTAQVNWQAVVPATSSGEVTATVSWSDGETENVALATDRGTDIVRMTMSSPYSGQSTRVFADPGVYTATLQVSAGGEVVATSVATVTLAAVDPVSPVDPVDPVDPVHPGASDGGEAPGLSGGSQGMPASGSSRGDLATTGAESWPLAAAGGAAVLIALALILRRRATQD